jgi:hypothetical protein
MPWPDSMWTVMILPDSTPLNSKISQLGTEYRTPRAYFRYKYVYAGVSLVTSVPDVGDTDIL